ncbi:TRAP transporter small permease subunit [Rhodobacteraceae bacterium N5(2021)]|uniref:TRAP transporter small permease protein n=1 Tax=Gymnodinialimonas phycosphaerae TaxID=2841589 RepID=A0A975YH66_9RHOB|nr:TRAP transporter small permease subunit [Gymnodinialimonas phycosphaerae]MBY4892451.1 TRAP transporter small permease subunit [Gymnodinialimonas phycosphaerae]
MIEKIRTWVTTGTDAIAGAMLAAMFATFLLQIGSRYSPQIIASLGWAETVPWLGTIAPLGWTLELCLILWIWIVFFGCAFCVRDKDHVTFDILYLAAPRGPRRVMALVGAAAIVGGMVWSFLPMWDYVDFMRIRRTSSVENPFTGDKIRLKWIFIIYMVFMAALIARYAWRFVDVIRNGPPDSAHAPVAVSPKDDA